MLRLNTFLRSTFLATIAAGALSPRTASAQSGLTAAARRQVIEGATAMLDSFYVFPAIAKQAGDSLRARLARGAYDSFGSGTAFATRLDQDLATIMKDKHLGVHYSATALPAEPRPTAEAPARRFSAEDRAFMASENCGFVKVERLAGNIGYLKFDAFAPVELCDQTATAAMSFVAGTKALIVDLRENHGGSPSMVAFIASYLFDGRTHINDLWTRRTNETKEFWTRDSLPGLRFGGSKPVYVLTSNQSFSAAEEFTYDLQSLKRATIVGEVTGGGAHPVAPHRIDDHFSINVPFARAINPVTKTNWEGKGVTPDIAVPAADALEEALSLARSSK